MVPLFKKFIFCVCDAEILPPLSKHTLISDSCVRSLLGLGNVTLVTIKKKK